MQVNNHIFGSVSDNNEETSLLLLNTIAYERRNALISVFDFRFCMARGGEGEHLTLLCEPLCPVFVQQIL